MTVVAEAKGSGVMFVTAFGLFGTGIPLAGHLAVGCVAFTMLFSAMYRCGSLLK
jgi:hypothetical protein